MIVKLTKKIYPDTESIKKSTKLSRYIFDITDIVNFFMDKNNLVLSGLPRISLLISHRAKSIRPTQVIFAFFDEKEHCYRSIPHLGKEIDINNIKKMINPHNIKERNFRSWKYKNKPLKKIYHNSRLSLLNTLNINIQQLITSRNKNFTILNPIENDSFIFLSSSWNSLITLNYLKKQKKQFNNNINIVALVPDMIPFVQSSEKETISPELFNEWLVKINELNASILTNSYSTKKDFKKWAIRNNIKHNNIYNFKFPSEHSPIVNGSERDIVQNIYNNQYVLSVGPIKKRKNGQKLIEAWHIVQNIIGNDVPKLVFAGPEAPDFARDTLKSNYNDNAQDIIFIDSPNDLELFNLYKNCIFTVYPSLYEGWGLPISESLWHGKICATSNTSSMPEAGGNICEYFSPKSAKSIANTLIKLIYKSKKSSHLNNKSKNKSSYSWNDCSASVLNILDQISKFSEPDSKVHE